MAEMLAVKPGQVLYTITRSRLGNTTLRTVHIHEVRIKEVDPELRFVIASWNGNPAQKFYRGEVAKWRTKRPVTVNGVFGSQRLATRAEIAEQKQSHDIQNGPAQSSGDKHEL